MTDETKQLFGAPWKADVCCEIHDKNESLICICCPGEPHIANRLTHLPELYDALNKQAYYRCVDCLRHTANTIDDIPLNRDMIEHGCPKNRTDCGAFDVWQLLKKVRDGK